MATKKKYEIGKEVEAFCTKCKLDRLHAIETLKSDGNINRVLCRTCDGSHLFRRPKGDGTKPPSKRRKKGSVILTEDDLKKAISVGIAKVNVASELIRAVRESLKEQWDSDRNPWTPTALVEAYRRMVPVLEKWIRLTGAAGKA